MSTGLPLVGLYCNIPAAVLMSVDRRSRTGLFFFNAPFGCPHLSSSASTDHQRHPAWPSSSQQAPQPGACPHQQCHHPHSDPSPSSSPPAAAADDSAGGAPSGRNQHHIMHGWLGKRAVWQLATCSGDSTGLLGCKKSSPPDRCIWHQDRTGKFSHCRPPYGYTAQQPLCRVMLPTGLWPGSDGTALLPAPSAVAVVAYL